MVTGATGLIGSALTARLISAGHIVFGVARTVKEEARRFPAAQWKTCDIARMTQSGLWVPYLEGVDAVVNCAGVLQDGPGIARAVSTSTASLHYSRRVSRRECGAWCIFPLSALIVKLPQHSLHQLEGDRSLMASDLDWIVLRPSRRRRPARLWRQRTLPRPCCPAGPPCRANTGLLQVVQLDDVADTVLFFLAPGAPARLTLDLAGPERLAFTEVVRSTAVGSVGGNRGLFASRLGSQVPPIVSATSRDAWAGVRRCDRLPVAKSSGELSAIRASGRA